MADTAILKSWLGDAYWPSEPAVKISNFLKSRMANGRHLKLKAVNSYYLNNCRQRRPAAGKYSKMTTLAQ